MITSLHQIGTMVLDESRLRLRMSAGATLLDVHKILIERGYRLPTQTGGPIFSLGGVFMSPYVHGESCRGRPQYYASYGCARQQSEVRHCRGSMGLLGLVLNVELRIERFEGRSGKNEIIKFGKDWNKERFESVTRSKMDGTDYFNVHYSYWKNACLYRTDSIDGKPEDFDVEAAMNFYNELDNDYLDLGKTGGDKLSAALSNLIEAVAPAPIVAEIVLNTIKNSGNQAVPGDGYAIFPNSVVAPNMEITAFIRCESDCFEDGMMFGVLDATRQYFDREHSFRFPSTRTEIRLFTVKEDSMTLEHLRLPGRYMSVSYVELLKIGKTAQKQAEKLMGLQRVWDEFSQQTMSSHHGKQ